MIKRFAKDKEVLERERLSINWRRNSKIASIYKQKKQQQA